MKKITLKKENYSEIRPLTRYLIVKLKAFYDDPENQKEFEEWRRAKKEAVKSCWNDKYEEDE